MNFTDSNLERKSFFLIKNLGYFKKKTSRDAIRKIKT